MEILIFGLGFILGGISMYHQIKMYRKSLGFKPGPLDECDCGDKI